MPNVEHLAILKRGVREWNSWRLANNETNPDLADADLGSADLAGAFLSNAYLVNANLERANLEGADLQIADLSHANLIGANLKRAGLTYADLTQVDFSGADLTEAIMGWTVLAGTNLSRVNGLARIKHEGPSTIGLDTFFKSKDKLPDVLLRGAGVPDIFIDYAASLGGTAFEFYSCFISYSSKDDPWVQRLYTDLQAKGVRCWFAPEDLKIGEKIRVGIDEAIRIHDKLLLVLSEASVQSAWVEKEVETAFEKERNENRLVLFPIRLDDAVMKVDAGWAADIKRSRNIGDFRKWRDNDAYAKAVERLLRDLKSEGAKHPPRGLE